jgi:hypothetical protein
LEKNSSNLKKIRISGRFPEKQVQKPAGISDRYYGELQVIGIFYQYRAASIKE